MSGVAPAGPAQGGLRVYGRLLLSPRWGALISAAFIARLPGVMVPIGLVLVIADLRGSYAEAGLVTAAFAVGSAVAAPWTGRLLDRHGPRRVVPLSALVSGGLLVALAVVLGDAPSVELIALAALAGAAQPPIGPALRVGVRSLFADQAHRQAGYALDSVSVEAVYVVGPLCLSLLLGLGQQEVLLVVAAGVLVAGSVAFSGAMPPVPRPPQSAPAPPGRRPSVLRGQAGRVIGVSAAIAITFGVMDTAMVGAAGLVLGDQQHVGLLFAATAGGSVIGGLVFGARGSRRTQLALLRLLLGCFAATLGVVALLTAVDGIEVWALLPCLFLCGLTIAPVMITVANLVDLSVPPGRTSEGQSLKGSATTAGIAAGTALTGLLLDVGGVAVSFGVGALVVAVALAAVGRAPRQPDDEPTGPALPAPGAARRTPCPDSGHGLAGRGRRRCRPRRERRGRHRRHTTGGRGTLGAWSPPVAQSQPPSPPTTPAPPPAS